VTNREQAKLPRPPGTGFEERKKYAKNTRFTCARWPRLPEKVCRKRETSRLQKERGGTTIGKRGRRGERKMVQGARKPRIMMLVCVLNHKRREDHAAEKKEGQRKKKEGEGGGEEKNQNETGPNLRWVWQARGCLVFTLPLAGSSTRKD